MRKTEEQDVLYEMASCFYQRRIQEGLGYLEQAISSMLMSSAPEEHIAGILDAVESGRFVLAADILTHDILGVPYHTKSGSASHLVKNTTSMQRGFPELYDRFLSYPGQSEMSPERFHSTYDPDYEAGEWMKGQKEPDSKHILIFGLAGGTFAREICSKRRQGCDVLIYEPSPEIFRWSMNNADLAFCFEKGVRLVVNGINEDLFPAIMEEMLSFEDYQDYQIYMTPDYEKEFPEGRKSFIRHFAKDGLGWMESRRSTEAHWLHFSVNNLLRNICQLKDHLLITDLFDRFPKTVPVVIIGAGPSLSEDVEILKRAGERAFLIAADTAMDYLREQGVHVDAFISIEPDRPVEMYADGSNSDTVLIAKFNTMYKMIECQRNHIIFGYDQDEFIKKLYEENDIPLCRYRGGLNSLTTLFCALDEMGVETIILVGQDMCFGTGGVSHISKREDYHSTDEVETNSGERKPTRQDWLDMISWYENAIYDTSVKHVINSTIKGAGIKGTTVMPLEEALDAYGIPHESLDDILNRAMGKRMEYHLDVDAVYRSVLRDIEELEKKHLFFSKLQKKDYDSLGGALLYKYAIADEKGNIDDSVRAGISEIRDIIDEISFQKKG